MERIALIPIAEVKKDRFTIIDHGKVSIGIIKVEGGVKCYLNSCPHAGAPICMGKVSKIITGNKHNEKVAGNELIVKCPWHGWEFHIKTGQSYLPGLGKLVALKSEVIDGQVVVYL